ncbi:cation efflux protein [Melampsora americana]|nr:cation efflux protein [Melampsora americana]
MSRSLRIKCLLFIDVAFFLVELIVGHWVGSLALVADSFHMLNDVFSLLVALYTIKLARRMKSEKYSYGWQRAEILGALGNSVFLLALAFSMLLQAIQKAIEPSEVHNPKLVVIVGSLGLAFNVIGLALFHEHGHSHGSTGHTHSCAPIEEKHVARTVQSDPPVEISEQPSLIAATLPEPRTSATNTTSPPQLSAADVTQSSPHPTLEGIAIHPSQRQNKNVRAADSPRVQSEYPDPPTPTSSQPINVHLNQHDLHQSSSMGQHQTHASHSHMNMHAVFLHVLGDALGNLGVIISGLLIWLVPVVHESEKITQNRWVLYVDPVVTLVISVFIFCSALPLVRSASFILLQGTPTNVNTSEVRKSIQSIDGVLQVHELHIWSLSESKSVASVHVLIQTHDDFTRVSSQIRKSLHKFGIHSR